MSYRTRTRPRRSIMWFLLPERPSWKFQDANLHQNASLPWHSCIGPYSTFIHTLSLFTYRQFQVANRPNLYVFGLWEETRSLRGNPHRHMFPFEKFLFTSTCHEHTSRFTEYIKLPIVMNDRVNPCIWCLAMESHPIQGVFPYSLHCSQNRQLIHCITIKCLLKTINLEINRYIKVWYYDNKELKMTLELYVKLYIYVLCKVNYYSFFIFVKFIFIITIIYFFSPLFCYCPLSLQHRYKIVRKPQALHFHSLTNRHASNFTCNNLQSHDMLTEMNGIITRLPFPHSTLFLMLPLHPSYFVFSVSLSSSPLLFSCHGSDSECIKTVFSSIFHFPVYPSSYPSLCI